MTMFPSFYKPSQLPRAHGIEVCDAYAFGDKTSAGEIRLMPPQQLAGSNRDLLRHFGSDCGAGVNCVGSINFFESPATETLVSIAEDFAEYSYAGIDLHRRLYACVGHRKLLKATVQRSADVHFWFSPVLLGPPGLIFRPHFPRADYWGYRMWAERWNYALGLASPWDPSRRRTTAPRIHSWDSPEVVRLKIDIGTVIHAAWNADMIRKPADISDLLLGMPGVKVARPEPKSTVIEIEDFPKPVRLYAPVYAEGFDADELREKIEKLKRMSRDEVEDNYRRIIQRRVDRHFHRYGNPVLRITFANLQNLQLVSLLPTHAFLTSTAQLWKPVFELEAFTRISIRGIESTCEWAQFNLERISREFSSCFERTERVDEGSQGPARPTERVHDAIERFRRHHEALRSSVWRGCQPDNTARSPHNESRNASTSAHPIDEPLADLAQRVAEFPAHAEELERAIHVRHARGSMTARAHRWFLEGSSTVRPEVIIWLKAVDPAGLKMIPRALVRESVVAEKLFEQKTEPIDRQCI